MRALVLALLLCSGCGVFSDLFGDGGPDFTEIRNEANGYRVELNELARDLAQQAPLITAYCKLQPGKACDLLTTGYELSAAGIEAARKAVDVYDKTGIGAGRVQSAIEGVKNAVSELVKSVEGVAEVLHGQSDRASGEPGVEPARASDRTETREGEGRSDPAPAPAEG